jgi:hypothetical protein
MPLQKGDRIDFLSAADAYDLRKRCSVNHLKVLYGLIEDVERKIHIAASSGNYDIIYTVPLYSSELPMYNQHEMRNELVAHFRRQKFFVMPIHQTRIPPTSFYINWKNV